MKGRTQLSSRSPRSPRALPRQKPNSASPTSANIRWITRLIGIGGASRLPLPYGGSVDLDGLAAMHDALHHVLTTVAASGAHLHFGICQDCAYLGGKTCCSSTSSPLRPDERTVN